MSDGVVVTASHLEGRVLDALEQDEAAFRFRFAGGLGLSVDLSETAWICPEAILFHGPGDQTVVVN